LAITAAAAWVEVTLLVAGTQAVVEEERVAEAADIVVVEAAAVAAALAEVVVAITELSAEHGKFMTIAEEMGHNGVCAPTVS
jgi:hypothetical protein